MQDQNDNMDDLFRKAAEEYPLKVGIPDWNKIAGAVSKPESAAPRSIARYRRFFWLLLLIPFGFICNYIDKPGDFFTGNSSTSAALPAPASKNPVGGNRITIVENSTANKKTAPAVNPEQIAANKNNSPAIAAPDNNQSRETTRGAKNVSGFTKKNNFPEPKGGDRTLTNAPEEAGTLTTNIKSGISGPANVPGYKSRTNKNRNRLSDKYLTSFPADHPDQRSVVYGRQRKKGSRDFDSARPRQQKMLTDDETGFSQEPALEPAFNLPGTARADSALVTASGEMLTLTAGPVSKNLHTTDRRLYIGFAGGADISTVKLQKLSKTGSQYGGIIGYQFAKRWSVEAGFFVETKHYYTDGEYFDKGGLTVNPNSKILTIEGVCSMYELPLTLKYDLSNNFRSNWFVTAGLSSYIMKRENYDMLYLYTGSGSTSVHKYEYKNSSRNLFSQLRLTAGYAYKLPRNFSLRLEPYLNMPVSGVGYGKLKLNSAGINAGIFKRLF